MSIDVRQLGPCSVVRVGDHFDPGFAAWLGHALSQFVRDEPDARLVIDLTEVAPIDPHAAAALWTALDTGEAPIAIVSKRLSARRIVRRWGGKRWLVFPTVSVAVDALTSALVGAGLEDREPAFCHEAFLYAGTEAFVEGTAAFVSDALAADEPVLVAVSAERVELLRRRLGHDAARVGFADMAEVGRNPARIIPAWQDLLSAHQGHGRRLRGVGELICSERTATDVVECQHHESLVNVAFADSRPSWLLCPYDTESLAPAVIEEAQRSHPMVLSGGIHQRSGTYRDGPLTAPFDGPLPPAPGGEIPELRFDAGSLAEVPAFAARRADAAELWPDRVRDLARAVAEVAANSVVHGGGRGRVRVWTDGDGVVCEVRDAGHITDPLVGRVRPVHEPGARRGLWLANQLCDLVQIRSSASRGTVVRLHLRSR